MSNNFRKIIKKLCFKNNIECRFLSRDWVIMLKKDNKVRFISGYKFGINNHALGEILDDKFALFDLLKHTGISVARHNIQYSHENLNDYAIGYNDYQKVKEYLKSNNNTIIIKPNKGTCGNDVYKVTSEEEIDLVLSNLLSNHLSVSYCPYYDIKNEYRIIVLEGKIKLIYKKKKPVVIGNGHDSIRDLLLKFNKPYFKDKLSGEEYNRVLKKNEKYEFNWRFNLSGGASVDLKVEEEVKNKLKDIINQIVNNFDIGFASIDIIETNKKFMVLEINSGVMMENIYNIIDNKKIVEDIYEEALLCMFKK